MTTSILHDFNVRIVGRGDETIVLAHGFGNNQYAWDFQVKYFRENYRLVLFDHVGSGNMENVVHNPEAVSEAISKFIT